jgi:hypothetical protein
LAGKDRERELLLVLHVVIQHHREIAAVRRTALVLTLGKLHADQIIGGETNVVANVERGSLRFIGQIGLFLAGLPSALLKAARSFMIIERAC